MDPLERYLLVCICCLPFRWFKIDLGDGFVTPLPIQLEGEVMPSAAISPDGRLVVFKNPGDTRFQIFDLQTGAVRFLETSETANVYPIEFLPDGRLLGDTSLEVRAWNLQNGTYEVVLASGDGGNFVTSHDGRFILVSCVGWCDSLRSESKWRWVMHDLETGSSRVLPREFAYAPAYALEERGSFAVTGDAVGVIRVMPMTEQYPHLLLGHKGPIKDVAVDPQGRWIASCGHDKTVRLWPIPKGEPFHRLPYEEFLKRLRRLTNLRAVPDSTSNTGYKIDYAEFPGWEDLPSW